MRARPGGGPPGPPLSCPSGAAPTNVSISPWIVDGLAGASKGGLLALKGVGPGHLCGPRNWHPGQTVTTPVRSLWKP